MRITGVSLDDFRDIVKWVSEERYGGNVVVSHDAHDLGGVRRPRTIARVMVQDSRGRGARRSASGRHGPYACWHVYRDVLRLLFELYPDAVVHTFLATYRGLDGFLDTYPDTANHNIGSMVEPAYMPDLCDCSMIDSIDWDLAAAAMRIRQSESDEQFRGMGLQAVYDNSFRKVAS